MRMTGYTFPNETVIWSLLIANYPFITGLVAGSFIVSSMYYVFGWKKLKPVAKLSLLLSLTFLIISFLPLLGHLGQPSRATEILTRPQFDSAMAVFGYIYVGYLILTVIETIFVFREGIVAKLKSASGLQAGLYRLLALGSTTISDRTAKKDSQIVRVLAFIGIPVAIFFHGYVGFIFGAVKANPIWSTPLMPIVFILSAIVSGIALLSVVYIVSSFLIGQKPSGEVLSSLGMLLGGFLLLDLSFHGLEHLFGAYEQLAVYDAVETVYGTLLYWSHLWVELIIGGGLPLLLAFVPQIRRSTAGAFVTSLLVLAGVYAMRWDVVIGGQLLSRTGMGFLSYAAPLFGREGILAMASIYSLGLFVMLMLLSIFPWREETGVVKTVG